MFHICLRCAILALQFQTANVYKMSFSQNIASKIILVWHRPNAVTWNNFHIDALQEGNQPVQDLQVEGVDLLQADQVVDKRIVQQT